MGRFWPSLDVKSRGPGPNPFDEVWSYDQRCCLLNFLELREYYHTLVSCAVRIKFVASIWLRLLSWRRGSHRICTLARACWWGHNNTETAPLLLGITQQTFLSYASKYHSMGSNQRQGVLTRLYIPWNNCWISPKYFRYVMFSCSGGYNFARIRENMRA